LATVRSLTDGVLVLAAERELGPEPVQMGESVAVNGVCLTIVGPLTFDLSPETLERSSLGDLRPGSKVNLERAMRADGRFGGHIVQGHVDATGEVVSIRPEGNSTVFRFRVPEEGRRYLIDKGSITIDGISLTVVEPQNGEFDVWVIPHTLENTNLGSRKPGDRVNLEYDVLARYLERLIRPHE
jgi:riboflavin synthase